MTFEEFKAQHDARRERQIEAADRTRQRLAIAKAVLAQCPPRAVAIAVSPDLVETPSMRQLRACPAGGTYGIHGAPGLGKTVMVVDRALRGNLVPVFVRAAELARSSRYGDERQALVSAEMLILDDLGAEDANRSIVPDLDEIVDSFYATPWRELVVTSNLDGKALAARYGARVVDRFYEAGTWLACKGKSMRKPGSTTDIDASLAAFRHRLATERIPEVDSEMCDDPISRAVFESRGLGCR